MQAFQIVEAYTDADGLPEWTRDDPTVRIEAKKKINQFHSSKDSRTSGTNYKPEPGEYYVPDVQMKPGNVKPRTYQQWRENKRKEFLATLDDGKLE